MPFLGTIVNFLAVFIGGIGGSLLKKGIPKRVSESIISAMSVCVLYIAVDGMLEPAPHITHTNALSDGLVKVLIMLVSMALGTLIGELINIDRRIARLGEMLEAKFASGAEGGFAKGFVTCSLIFCVGAMAVNGSILDAVGKPDTLLAKSVIDGITCFVMATSLGIGCAFSSFLVLAYQGILTLAAMFLSSFIPAATITYMSVTGSLIIFLVGTNLIGLTKVRTANMIPAIFLPAALAPLVSLIL